MNIARILYPVQVLGPGRRIGIWVCGCLRACKGCSNPELWNPRPDYEITVDQLMELIHKISQDHPVDGFTITGGEPMDQAADLADLTARLAGISEDILVYSGYCLEELHSSPQRSQVLDQIAVLIDGEYIHLKNNGSRIRGSSNQKIHILNPKFALIYDQYLKEGHNQIQNFTIHNGIISVGIHEKGFAF